MIKTKTKNENDYQIRFILVYLEDVLNDFRFQYNVV
jgi:hypothetical protein